MYKTINKVFSTSKKKGLKGGENGQIGGERSSAFEKVASQEGRPESPIRMGSPSSAAIGESTLKKIVKRAFYSESALGRKDSGKGGRGSDVNAEMLGFEVGNIMRRLLEVYDSMSEKMLSSLRSNLQAPGVVTLISNDLRVLWGLAGYEKQQELRLAAARVAVLGRKCKESSLHSLSKLFEKMENPEKDFKEYAMSAVETEILIRFMREQAEATANLKAEMEAIQLLHTRIQEYGEWNQLQEMVAQGKLVEKLQGHCLWAYNLDFLVQMLVLAVCSIRKKIFASFGQGSCPQKIKDESLGDSGLALHYANVVVLLERIIQQPDTVLGPTRDDLYDMLPRNVQYLLRIQLQDPLNFVADGRVESNLKRGLLLLPTMAHNTIHWHSLHTPGSSLDSSDVVFQVQTFYYANKAAVNAALVDVLLGLCRICGVESPIGFMAMQSPGGFGDYDQLVEKCAQEDEKMFLRQLGAEMREDFSGGVVLKVEDPNNMKLVASREKKKKLQEQLLYAEEGHRSKDFRDENVSSKIVDSLWEEEVEKRDYSGDFAAVQAGKGVNSNGAVDQQYQQNVPRQRSNDSNEGSIGSYDGPYNGTSSGTQDPNCKDAGRQRSSQKWKEMAFGGRSRSMRLSVNGSDLDAASFDLGAPETPTSRRGIQSNAIVGCFTGGGQPSEVGSEWDTQSGHSMHSTFSASSSSSRKLRAKHRRAAREMSRQAHIV